MFLVRDNFSSFTYRQNMEMGTLVLILLHLCLSALSAVTVDQSQLLSDLTAQFDGFCRTLWDKRTLIPRGSEREDMCGEGYEGHDLDQFTTSALKCVTLMSRLYEKQA